MKSTNVNLGREEHQGGRSGFTLVELLVVIAIIGVLIALLLPAIQAAREAARRSDCANKTRQLALALHTFHDTHNRLPNVYQDPVYTAKRFQRGSWIGPLLPFIEQLQVYDAVMSQGVLSSRVDFWSRPAAMVKIGTLICPSDPAGNLWKTGETCPTSYRGSMADMVVRKQDLSVRSWLRPGLEIPDSGTGVTTFSPIVPGWSNGGGGGSIGLEAIADGTSNSIMLSEGALYARDGVTTGGDMRSHLVTDQTGAFNVNPSTCYAALGEGKNLNASRPVLLEETGHNLGGRAFDDYTCITAFFTVLPPNSPSCSRTQWYDWAIVSASSYHPGGVNVAFLDASTRFIPDSIKTQNLGRSTPSIPPSTYPSAPQDATGPFSYGVWSELGSINGGENPALP